MLKVSLLGNFSISINDTPIKEFNSPRLQSLLAFLMLNSDIPQSRSRIASLFWPDTSEYQSRTNLRNLYHHLKKNLPDPGSFLVATAQTLQWQPKGDIIFDVAEFSDLLKLAEHSGIAPTSSRRSILEKAINLYKGDLLPGCFDEWIILVREGYRQDYLLACEKLIALLEENKDYSDAIYYARRLLQFDPLQESTYRNLMRLYALDGDLAGAIRVYHSCASIMQRELEVAPSIQTKEIYERLLGGENQYSFTPQVTSAIPHMVGRMEEWSRLQQTWRTLTFDGKPHVVMIAGEAGIGKTKLIEEMLQWASRQGISLVNTRCYAAEGELAYSPIIAWLRSHPPSHVEDACLVEIGRLIPEILANRTDLSRPTPLSESWQRTRFFDSLSKYILGFPQPSMIAIDDLQWCDHDTLEWLHYFLRTYDHSRILVIGSYRPEEIGLSHPLLPFLNDLRKNDQVTEIELLPLDLENTTLLIDELTGRNSTAEIHQVIYQKTEGNPLFIVETIRSGITAGGGDSTIVGNGTLELDLNSVQWMPPKVQTVLATRLAQLSAPARELAGIASTIGREFNYKLLSKITKLDEEILIKLLDELWQHRIIRENGTEDYDFYHDFIRETSYCSLGTTRRRLLHLQAAQALIALHKSNLNPVSHQIAAHFEHADEYERAVPYFHQAAKWASQVFANDEAIRLLMHGISLVTKSRSGSGNKKKWDMITCELFENLGDVMELAAQHDQALQAYQDSISTLEHDNHLWLARINRKMATVLKEKRKYPEALVKVQEAEFQLDVSKSGEEAAHQWDEWLNVQVEKAWIHYWMANWEQMDEVLKKVQPIVEARGSTSDRVRMLWISCLFQLRKNRYVVSDEMLANSHKAFKSSQEWGEYKYIVNCQFELGFLNLWKRNLVEAEDGLSTALSMVEKSGILPVKTLCLTYLTVLYRFLGNIPFVEKFSSMAEQSAEKTQMPDYIAAAKGNRAWLACQRGDLRNAEELGKEALEIWKKSPLIYPFQWQATWPLIACAWKRENVNEIKKLMQALMDQNQQMLPSPLSEMINEFIDSNGKSVTAISDAHLNRIMEHALQMKYI